MNLETVTAIRDWVVSAFVLYIAIRYGLLRAQERSAMKAEMERLRGLAVPSVAADLERAARLADDYAQKTQSYAERVRQLETELSKATEKEKHAVAVGISMGLRQAMYTAGYAVGAFESVIQWPGPIALQGFRELMEKRRKILDSYIKAAFRGEIPKMKETQNLVRPLGVGEAERPRQE